MQSAFVDVGLERDAFLYVTDFMELEDPEETDELEKAAVIGGNQAPREVRHAANQDRNGRQDERPSSPAPAPVPEQKQEPRQERQPRERRPAPEFAAEDTAASTASESPIPSEQDEFAEQESGEPGAKRWRGRRHRRGGRGPGGRAESAESADTYKQASPEPDFAPDIQAAAGASGDRSSSQGWPMGIPSDSQNVPAPAQERSAAPASRADRSPAPFVLPGESLSKYGGTSADDAPKPAQETPAPARPSSTFKPATLIEAPLDWDGSGLLPGESLSRHRTRQPEPAQEVESQTEDSAPDETEENDLVAEQSEPQLTSDPEPEVEPVQHSLATDEHMAVEPLDPEDLFEESTESAPKSPDAEDYEVEAVIDEPSGDEPLASPVTSKDEPAVQSDEPKSGASASHNVDPAAPTGFRLFGLGKKKKEEEEGAPKPASVASVSAYAPGSGLIEEEVIEEEEFDAPHHHHHKADEHDLDDYEEETLPTQIRSGDLGEMLQEAHLDHKIQLNFDDKSVEDESFDDDDEATSEAQPATGDAPAQQRRDRGTRGRRGRGTSGNGAPTQGNRRGGPSRRSMQTSDLPIISDLLKPGQEILVQIAKEPIAKKGARITSHIALPGRFLVFMPTVTHIGVSRKIASDDERQRLKRILVHERGEATGGFIVRTAAEGASEEDLRADLRFLLNLWGEIKTRSDDSKSPALIYHDLSLIERILRDQVSSNFSNIWVDSEADYERIVRFLNRFSPNLVRRVKLYTKETPLFEHFGIQDEISKALRSKVWLKSGGSIVINQTEALVAIDINTGKYVGKSARLEDTIVKTNLDAVPEIVRQIRLRDLGGIIVIDFIDMDDRKNRFRVLAALEEALKSDRAPTKVLQFNDFGLVAITRKRVKQSLERTLSVPCPTCQATGMVKSPTTVCNEIYTELRKMKKHFEGADVLLRVNPETVKVLKSNNASWLTEFEELVGKNILVKSDATLHPEQFDIQG
jgi:ribonuclease G